MEKEQVNHPEHYQMANGKEVIDVIEANFLDFHLGNAVKYLARAGKKDGNPNEQDCQKAEWYMVRWAGWKNRCDPRRPVEQWKLIAGQMVENALRELGLDIRVESVCAK